MTPSWVQLDAVVNRQTKGKSPRKFRLVNVTEKKHAAHEIIVNFSAKKPFGTLIISAA
ncbi:MAG: hypothetical protein ABI387_02425 [Lacunisphaera sp.]